MARERIKALRATAPSASGSALLRHERNPWYSATIVQTFADGSHEIEWSDTHTRTFVTDNQIQRSPVMPGSSYMPGARVHHVDRAGGTVQTTNTDTGEIVVLFDDNTTGTFNVQEQDDLLSMGTLPAGPPKITRRYIVSAVYAAASDDGSPQAYETDAMASSEDEAEALARVSAVEDNGGTWPDDEAAFRLTDVFARLDETQSLPQRPGVTALYLVRVDPDGDVFAYPASADEDGAVIGGRSLALTVDVAGVSLDNRGTDPQDMADAAADCLRTIMPENG